MKNIKIPEKIEKLPVYQPIEEKFNIRCDANECFNNISGNNPLNQMLVDIIKSIQFNRYPDPFCMDLKKAIAAKFNINFQNIVCANGSDELIELLEIIFTKDGGKIMTLSPDFSMYKFYCSLLGADCVEIKKNDEFEINIKELIDIANSDENIKMIIFSNPCNPTGQIIKKSEILKLAANVNQIVVIDEAYMDFASESVIDCCDKNEYKNLAVLKTFSKAYAAAGIRLGYFIGNIQICDALNAVKSPYNVNSITQSIGKALIENEEYVKSYISYVKDNINDFKSDIQKVFIKNKIDYRIYDTYANFIYIKTSAAVKIFEELKKYGISIRCFSHEYLRITIDNKDNNKIIADNLDKILRRYK